MHQEVGALAISCDEMLVLPPFAETGGASESVTAPKPWHVTFSSMKAFGNNINHVHVPLGSP